MVEGVKFVTDANGRKTAVQLDLAKYGELWEDIYDGSMARKRTSEGKSPFSMVKSRLRGPSGHPVRYHVTGSDEEIIRKAERIRALLGDGCRIIIEKDRLTIETDTCDLDVKKKLVEILGGRKTGRMPARNAKTLDFRVVIERAGGSFSAFSPDLPGCVATGKTGADARRRMRKAIKFHIQCREQDAVKNLKCAVCGKTAKRVTGLKYKGQVFTGWRCKCGETLVDPMQSNSYLKARKWRSRRK
jgi:predicted RNase H-like HicB family nuclease